jgi:hypothetical protein
MRTGGKNWKEIDGYSGCYLISDEGDVYSNKRDKYMSPGRDKDGYLCVGLCQYGVSKMWKVHRLVALHFIPNPENRMEVNHIDGDKRNNKVYNIEWCTRSENIRHSFDMGLRPLSTDRQRAAVSEYNKKHKIKPIRQCDKSGVTIEVYPSLAEAAWVTKIDMKNISSCCRGKIKSAGGFVWNYLTK